MPFSCLPISSWFSIFSAAGLAHVFDQNKTLYAFVALALIIAQGVGLEMLTTGLLRLIRRRES